VFDVHKFEPQKHASSLAVAPSSFAQRDDTMQMQDFVKLQGLLTGTKLYVRMLSAMEHPPGGMLCCSPYVSIAATSFIETISVGSNAGSTTSILVAAALQVSSSPICL
jgi:hypothetical protein